MPQPQLTTCDPDALGTKAFMWVPAAEFVDRYLITKIKSINEGADNHNLSAWTRAHENMFNEIFRHSYDVRVLCEELEKIHGQLWHLESLVRSVKSCSAQEFSELAHQIFTLNSARHEVKEKLNSVLNSFTFGKRCYS